MGMQLFSRNSTSLASSARPLMELSMEEDGPMRWQEKDGDPEEESWWTEKQIFVESFIDSSRCCSGSASFPVVASTSTLATGSSSAIHANQTVDDHTSQKSQHHHPHDDIPVSAGKPIDFPGRFTISEQELGQVSLDTITDNSDEDDFELAWDDDSEYGTDPSDIDSAISTPTPVTPVATHTVSLPVPVPVTSVLARRRTMPVPSTSANTASPLRSGSFQMSTSARTPPASMSPIAARSVNRVRGFALASPRTELVL